MKTCHIFCAGGFEKLAESIQKGDLVLAADEGLPIWKSWVFVRTA